VTATTSEARAAGVASPEPTAEQAMQTLRSKRFIALLAIVAVVGVVVSLASWCFLEAIYQIQRELFTHLPNALGYTNGPPLWWSLPVLGVGGLLVALAITRLPGDGGHLPARGLAMGGGPAPVINLPGVILAGLATVGFGLVLGPEAPLIALGSGVALLTVGLARREMPQSTLLVIAASGSFAALSFIFASPLIAAVILIEGTGIGGSRLPLILIPGLMSAGIGSLVSLGMGSFTGLSSAAFALTPIKLPHFAHPTLGQFAWTIVLGVAIAIGARVVMLGGLRTYGIVARRLLVALPIVGLIVAGLAIAFHGAADKSVNDVLFSGQDALPGLVSNAGSWSVGALVLLLAFKGTAWGLSLGSFRGGPTFPAIFLGAAAGILASHLPGFALTPAVGVGIGASVAAVLRLPLSGVVLATLITVDAGTGDEPLIIVGVIAAYLVTVALSARPSPAEGSGAGAAQPSATGERSGARV
jgi:chloride channel protein, CIC family